MIDVSLDKVFEVLSLTTNNSYTVKLQFQTCTCFEWEATGIPCSHAIAAILFDGDNPQTYTQAVFSLDEYRKTYRNASLHLTRIRRKIMQHLTIIARTIILVEMVKTIIHQLHLMSKPNREGQERKEFVVEQKVLSEIRENIRAHVVGNQDIQALPVIQQFRVEVFCHLIVRLDAYLECLEGYSLSIATLTLVVVFSI